ncbi:MAG: RuBisCO large subunit C-terminal-like domain-containing protein [Spirochaetia bacterium]|nr:RuBisCO large subunit C-terminal-like domain-containing protein [Spirochaetia bacterium]
MRLVVKYYIETTDDFGKTADLMAKMQSTGTWKEMTAETEAIVSRFGAKVESALITGEKSVYELPTKTQPGKKVTCGTVEISYPVENFGSKVSMLLTTIAGEIYDMAELTAVKVIDLKMPDDFLCGFKGPKFGVQGSREIVKSYDRPLFGAITKPCVGLSPKEISKLAYDVSRAGADFIKDDELLADAPYNRVKDRVIAVSEGLKKSYEETGRTTMYAFNVTDDPDEVINLHDTVAGHGGRALMFNVMAGGFGVLKKLSAYSTLPIHCHRDFAVTTFRPKYMGITSRIFTLLTRLCGGDQVQCGGIGGYLYETDEEILENIKACSEPLGSIKASLPVSSGGQWAGMVPVNMRKIGNMDFMLLAGGGVFSHPGGGYAGMRSIIRGYEEWMQGKKLEDSVDNDLRAAIRHFGTPVY